MTYLGYLVSRSIKRHPLKIRENKSESQIRSQHERKENAYGSASK